MLISVIPSEAKQLRLQFGTPWIAPLGSQRRGVYASQICLSFLDAQWRILE
jgi:hypothetical protein